MMSDSVSEGLFDLFRSINKAFSEDMWNGNAPCALGHKNINGGYNDLWQTRYGGGETYGDEIDFFTFYLTPKVSIFICGDYLCITDIRYAGKFDAWIYQNYNAIPMRQKDHYLETDKIEKFLNTKIDNCRIWEMIKIRTRDLIANGTQYNNKKGSML